MTRKNCLISAFALCLLGVRAHAGTLDLWGVYGLSGGYYGSQIQANEPVGSGIWSFSARARAFRFQDAMSGVKEEYSIGVRRELYHVSLAGRLGTAPPNTERAEYHLAQGEALLTFYGLSLGPEHPDLSALIWESTGPAPSPESLDQAWVTSFRTIYTNTNIHLERPASLLVVVENSWQFELRETWNNHTSLAAYNGHNRYNKVMNNAIETIFLDNIQYPGNPFALRGWPNNYVAGEVWQKLWSSWKISAACTRLNLLNNGMAVIYGVELGGSLGSHWQIRSGYYHKSRRFVETREGVSLSAAYLW